MIRRTPYTEAGLARLTCTIPGCDRQASEQWQVRSCKVGGPNTWRAVCGFHDGRLNRWVIRTFGLEAS